MTKSKGEGCVFLGNGDKKQKQKKGMRKPGIEPGTSVWETNILPLNYLRRGGEQELL